MELGDIMSDMWDVGPDDERQGAAEQKIPRRAGVPPGHHQPSHSMVLDDVRPRAQGSLPFYQGACGGCVMPVCVCVCCRLHATEWAHPMSHTHS
jgi:hypothetical protein